MLWPSLFIPNQFKWEEIRRKYEIFAREDQKEIRKRIVMDILLHVTAGNGLEGPVAILLGLQCFVTKNKRAIFQPPSSSLHNWDMHFSRWVVNAKTADGCLETAIEIMPLYGLVLQGNPHEQQHKRKTEATSPKQSR